MRECYKIILTKPAELQKYFDAREKCSTLALGEAGFKKWTMQLNNNKILHYIKIYIIKANQKLID